MERPTKPKPETTRFKKIPDSSVQSVTEEGWIAFEKILRLSKEDYIRRRMGVFEKASTKLSDYDFCGLKQVWDHDE